MFERRCSWNPLFTEPLAIQVLDDFKGTRADYVLVSLVRTESVGYFRNMRRQLTALTRASLGLYIFGRFDLFNSCPQLLNTTQGFAQRPLQLMLYPKEKYNATSRKVTETGYQPKKGAKDIEVVQDVIQMGKIVYEMCQSTK